MILRKKLIKKTFHEKVFFLLTRWGYVTNKTLSFINTKIHAKIQKKINTIFKEKRYLC